MLFLLNWRGRGYVALLSIFAAILCILPGELISDDMGLLTMAIGWFAAGVTCLILGRRWNRAGNVHRFCTFPLQAWGVVYAGIGLLLFFPALSMLRMSIQQHHH